MRIASLTFSRSEWNGEIDAGHVYFEGENSLRVSVGLSPAQVGEILEVVRRAQPAILQSASEALLNARVDLLAIRHE